MPIEHHLISTAIATPIQRNEHPSHHRTIEQLFPTVGERYTWELAISRSGIVHDRPSYSPSINTTPSKPANDYDNDPVVKAIQKITNSSLFRWASAGLALVGSIQGLGPDTHPHPGHSSQAPDQHTPASVQNHNVGPTIESTQTFTTTFIIDGHPAELLDHVASVPAQPPPETVMAAAPTIVGGDNAPAGSDKDTVSLRHAGTHECEGVVIADNNLLTTADCANDKQMEVWGGSLQLSGMTKLATAVNVYTFPSPVNLVIIGTDVPLNKPPAHLVPLPDNQPFDPVGKQVNIFGHGNTTWEPPYIPTNEYQVITETILPTTDCFQVLYPQELCWEATPIKAVAEGDGGGKVQLVGTDTISPTLVGIVTGVEPAQQRAKAAALTYKQVQEWVMSVLGGKTVWDPTVLRDEHLFHIRQPKVEFTYFNGLLSQNSGMQQKVDTYDPLLYQLTKEGNLATVSGSHVVVSADGSFYFTLPDSFTQASVFVKAHECATLEGKCQDTIATIGLASIFMPSIELEGDPQ